ncbi:MAG: hypothetical protein KF701_01845 [Anaerolineales bacterium]|nr:MAG: hypothetical protein KF701_01845 [Anaerolineales bacterium]
MDKKQKKSRWPVAVWVLVVLMAVLNYSLLYLQRELYPDRVYFEFLWRTAALTFAIVGALIISRERRHLIGWLLMVTPIMITVATVLSQFMEPRLQQATTLDTGLLVYVWFNTWSWWLLIGPILLIFFLFPTGKLLTRGWRWGVSLTFFAFALFLFLATFTPIMEVGDGEQLFANPIGFLSEEVVGVLLVMMTFFLVAGALTSLVSVFARYRRSEAVERAQMRWLFIACAIFVLNYAIGFVVEGYIDSSVGETIFILSVFAIPLSIGIAILRYRLWDVDVVINRSLVYGVLTTLLAALFAGTAAVLSQIAKAAFGEEMQQAAAAVAAIVVASLFTPIRTRVEGAINRRLFPENVDLSQGLVELNANLWNWLSLPRILDSTLEHLEAIYGHEQSAIYLRRSAGEYVAVAARGVLPADLPAYQASPAEQDLLAHKKGILSDEAVPFVLTTPIYLARRKGPELIGVLRLGKRKQGRGFTGGDVKTLTSFGAKLGEPIYALGQKSK